jgi:hypothetical protein
MWVANSSNGERSCRSQHGLRVRIDNSFIIILSIEQFYGFNILPLSDNQNFHSFSDLSLEEVSILQTLVAIEVRHNSFFKMSQVFWDFVSFNNTNPMSGDRKIKISEQSLRKH